MPPAKKPVAKEVWVRNLHYVPASIKLSSGRRIELKPRGQRGDSAPVTKEEREDQNFVMNAGLIFEEITKAEAESVVAKQTTNQQAQHPVMEAMRNELGQKYSDNNVVISKPFEQQSFTVAQTDNGEIIIDRGTGIRRAVVPGSVGYEMGGEAEQMVQAQEQAANAQSIEDALGGAKIVIDDTKAS